MAKTVRTSICSRNELTAAVQTKDCKTVVEETQGNVSTSHMIVFINAALLLVLLTIVTALGILVGRMWQRRVDWWWHELPAVDEDGYLEDETSLNLQTRFMD
jgi:hypothetical protein